MNNNLKSYSDTTKDYIQQIKQLLDMAEKSDRKRIALLTPILNKLKSSLQNLINQQELFKKYINNPAKYKSLLQPFVDLLNETKAEIERLNHEPKY